MKKDKTGELEHMPTIRETLMKYTNEYLIELIFHLMDRLDEKERIEFISKHISAEIALEAAGYNDSSSFLRKVSDFCKDCLNGDYYIEPEYDDYYNDECYDNMDESEWAEKFTEYLKLAIMYSRNNDYEVSYQAFDKLLDCLHEAEVDEELLGTAEPTDYIDVDWNEVFEQYYGSMKNQVTNKEQFTEKALEIWLNFGERCTEAVLKNIDDLNLIEKSIRKMIADHEDEWPLQHMLYELLRSCYSTLGEEFNELAIAGSLTSFNSNFLNDVAGAYMKREAWEDTIDVIKEALQKVTEGPVIASLNTKLVDSYEKLGMYGQAFEVAAKMFCSGSNIYYPNTSHDLYKRARFFAQKLDNINSFVDSMETYIRLNKRYDSLQTLLTILSFEGRTEKLIETALKSDGYSRHDYLKYTSKSLIYRAVGHEQVCLPDLKEYIESIESSKIPGIVDMVRLSEDSEKKEYLLNNAVKILKIMVQFHIDAATRSRYQRAAYYCAVIKDIHTYIGKKNEFIEYYGDIIRENNRRPALKDEMKKKIGYS